MVPETKKSGSRGNLTKPYASVFCCSECFPDLSDKLLILRIGKRCPVGIHRKDIAPLIAILVLGHEVHVQVVHRIPIGAEVDLVRVKDFVQAEGCPVDVLDVLGTLFLRELCDVIHVAPAGDNHPSRVALLLRN